MGSRGQAQFNLNSITAHSSVHGLRSGFLSNVTWISSAKKCKPARALLRNRARREASEEFRADVEPVAPASECNE
jgi:hypothetical protein